VYGDTEQQGFAAGNRALSLPSMKIYRLTEIILMVAKNF
jgi:hypothetical protein